MGIVTSWSPGRGPISPGMSATRAGRFLPFRAHAGQVVRFCCAPGGFPGMTQADMERDVTGYIRLWRL
jgi:hypothetical protein